MKERLNKKEFVKHVILQLFGGDRMHSKIELKWRSNGGVLLSDIPRCDLGIIELGSTKRKLNLREFFPT